MSLHSLEKATSLTPSVEIPARLGTPAIVDVRSGGKIVRKVASPAILRLRTSPMPERGVQGFTPNSTAILFSEQPRPTFVARTFGPDNMPGKPAFTQPGCSSRQFMDIFGKCIDAPEIRPRVEPVIDVVGQTIIDENRAGTLTDPSIMAEAERTKSTGNAVAALLALFVIGLVFGG